MHNTKMLLLLLLSILVIESCSKKTENSSEQFKTKISLRQEWFPNAGYAGEVFAVYETAKNHGIDLNLVAGSDEVDPIKMVLSGSNDFGVASADRILISNEKGARLVIIGVVNYVSPACFIAKAEKNIKSPKDFEGKKVGILTGTNNEIIYNIMTKKLDIDRKKIKEVEIPFDLGTFISDNYDVRPAFVYDEPVSLDQKGIRYTVVEPKNYGINFVGTAYFTTEKMINEKGDVVQAFVDALAEGWEKALQNPVKAIEYLKKYDANVDTTREFLSLTKGLDYFRGENGKALYAGETRWLQMAAYLKEEGLIKEFDLNKVINNTFIEKYNKVESSTSNK